MVATVIKKNFVGSASIGLFTSRFSLEGPIVKEKSSFVLGFRTTYSDWILNQLPEDSGYKDGIIKQDFTT